MSTIEEQRKQWRREHRPGQPSILRLDAEVRGFVDTLTPQAPYNTVARACLERFGKERAPSWKQIARYWEDRIAHGTAPPRCPHRKSKIEIDAAIKAFVDEMLPVMGFVALAQSCRDVFGPGRAPSKTTLHRYWMKTKEAAGVDDT